MQDVFSLAGPSFLGLVEIVWEGKQVVIAKGFPSFGAAKRWCLTCRVVKQTATGRWRVVEGLVSG